MLVLILISIYPTFFNLYNSLFDWNFTKPKSRAFVGLMNFWNILTDRNFLVAMSNTLILVISAVAVEFLLGFAIALLLNQARWGTKLVRSLMITPTMVAPIVASLMWLLMYNSDYGIVKYLFQMAHIPAPASLLASKTWAMPAIIFVDVWQWTPFVMLVLFAGLTAVPKDQIEASCVDGASAWQRMFSITLPSMKPVITVVLLMRIMDAFKFFEPVFMLTKGGPGDATETMSFHAYKVGFQFFEIGQSSAICLVILVIITVVCQLLNRLIADEWTV